MFRDFMEQTLKNKVHNYHTTLSQSDFDAAPLWMKNEIRVSVAMHKDLVRSTHYYFEVDQVTELRDLKLDEGAFPRCPHPLTFIEFNGILHYNYDHITSKVQFCVSDDGTSVVDVDPRRMPGGADYRGVLIRTNETGEWIQAHWFDRRGNVFSIGITRDDWPKTDFTAKGLTPKKSNEMSALLEDEQSKKDWEPPEWREDEQEHLRHMYRVSVNLMYFLMSENLTFVKIRPEHRRTFGAELKSLPKSDRPYRILSFQTPRYRYLERSTSAAGSSGRHNVRHDVRGFFRHLRDDCYGRDETGNVRTTWVRSHQRGLSSEIYRPTLRVGHIGAHLLDYDEFVRETEAKKTA